MELPFTIVFEPPSWAELRALLRMRGHWVAGSIIALTIGTIYLLANVAHADAVAAASGIVPLTVISRPPGARIALDGRESGLTPRDLPVRVGPHTLKLTTGDALEMEYVLDVSETNHTLEAVLWRTQPAVTRLRATLPGATLADVRQLADGSIGLSIALLPGPEVQGWRLDTRSGGVTPVLDHVGGRRLTFSPDGRYVAYLGSEIGPPRTSLDPIAGRRGDASVVWFTLGDGSQAPVGAWRAPVDSGEELADVSWSPGADRFVAFTHQALSGGAARSRVWLVGSDGDDVQPVLSLPSDVVPGSVSWSPDGRAITFVAHAGELNALCLLRIDGTFVYVADLDPSPGGPVDFSPAAWSADGQQLAFVAPHQHPPGSVLGILQPDAGHAVFVASIASPTPRLLSDTTADLVTWREDGQLLLIGRPESNRPLTLGVMGATVGAAPRPLIAIPINTPARYAATWDVARATAVLAAQTTGGGLDFWLVRLGVEDGS